jgi:hypothetical protein
VPFLINQDIQELFFLLTGWNVYQPGGQRILYQGLSAFICVHPVKRSFVTMMDTDDGMYLFS